MYTHTQSYESQSCTKRWQIYFGLYDVLNKIVAIFWLIMPYSNRRRSDAFFVAATPPLQSRACGGR